MLMTREQILGAQDIGWEDVDLSDIPGWGTVRIKDLSAAERDALELSLVQERVVKGPGGRTTTTRETRMDNVRATFVAAAVVDEDLRPIFSRSDLQALGGKSAKALDRLFNRVRVRNGLTAEDVEELAQDFDSAQS
jgi:hypothetical protein